MRHKARGTPDVGLTLISSGWAGAYPYGDGNARESAYARAARLAKTHRGATTVPFRPGTIVCVK